MQKIDTKISIIRNNRGEIIITIRDEASRTQFVEVTMAPENFALAVVTGQCEIECVAEVRYLEIVGKKKITEPRSAIVPGYLNDKSEISEWLKTECAESGWIVNANIGSRHSITYEEGQRIVKYSVVRYE